MLFQGVNKVKKQPDHITVQVKTEQYGILRSKPYFSTPPYILLFHSIASTQKKMNDN